MLKHDPLDNDFHRSTELFYLAGWNRSPRLTKVQPSVQERNRVERGVDSSPVNKPRHPYEHLFEAAVGSVWLRAG
jgi:hypothetical protein